MEAAMKKAGITYGKWYNDKVVYTITIQIWTMRFEKMIIIHIGLVTRLSRWKCDQASTNWRIPKGVAPEAQLIFMRVFSDKKGADRGKELSSLRLVNASQAWIADTINMSFEVELMGPSEYQSPNREAFNSRVNPVLSSAATGNYAVKVNVQAKPKADAPDTGTIDGPAIEDGVLAVVLFNK